MSQWTNEGSKLDFSHLHRTREREPQEGEPPRTPSPIPTNLPNGQSPETLVLRIAKLEGSSGSGLASRHFDQSGHPTLTLLQRGTVLEDPNDPVRSAQAPALAISPASSSRELALNGQALGVMITFHQQGLNLLSAREPRFGRLFREPRALPVAKDSRQFHSLKSIISALSDEWRHPASAQVTAISAYGQLLLTTAVRLLDQIRVEEIPNLSGRALRYIRLADSFLSLVTEHGRDHWRIQDYAKALHVSTDHLRASCVRATGCPPLQHIHTYLLEEAKNCLTHTTTPVAAIALDLGFDDPAYFSRLFSSKIGASPIQYRRDNGPTCPAKRG